MTLEELADPVKLILKHPDKSRIIQRILTVAGISDADLPALIKGVFEENPRRKTIDDIFRTLATIPPTMRDTKISEEQKLVLLATIMLFRRLSTEDPAMMLLFDQWVKTVAISHVTEIPKKGILGVRNALIKHLENTSCIDHTQTWLKAIGADVLYANFLYDKQLKNNWQQDPLVHTKGLFFLGMKSLIWLI